MNKPLTPELELDILRCPPPKCTCGKGGKALLCKVYRPRGTEVVVETVCPNAKANLLRLELGGSSVPASQMSQFERITAGFHLLASCGVAYNYQAGLLICLPDSAHMTPAVHERLSQLGWRWDADYNGYYFPLSTF